MIAVILAIALAAQTAAGANPQSRATEAAPPVTSPALLRDAVQFDMTSKSTGRNYRIYVSKPQGASPPGGFPVLYVLDGDKAFATASMEANMRPFDGRPPMVVVGIGYPDGDPFVRRNPDLTPSMPTGVTAAHMAEIFGPATPEAFGGAESFHRFMAEELRPAIVQYFAANPKDQSLMGYSLGGLFVLHVLFRHPDSYQNYLIGSPSIWWNDREVLKDEASFSALVKAGKVAPRILITSDEWEQFEGSPTLPPPGPARQEALARMSSDRMVDNARDLASRLKALKGDGGYDVRYAVFAEETHVSGLAAATSRGVAFVSGH